MNETFIPASDYTRKKWYVIDCQGKQLGRISSSIVEVGAILQANLEKSVNYIKCN